MGTPFGLWGNPQAGGPGMPPKNMLLPGADTAPVPEQGLTGFGAPSSYLQQAQQYIQQSPFGAPYRNPFLYFPSEGRGGEETWFARHPRATTGIESALTAVGSMGPPGLSIGENISNAARGIVAAPMARREHLLQQMQAPYQLAGSMIQMQKNLQEMATQQAHAQFYRQYGAFRQAEAENWGTMAYARLVAAHGRANVKELTDQNGRLQGWAVNTPQGMQTIPFQPPQQQEGFMPGPGGEMLPTGGGQAPMPGMPMGQPTAPPQVAPQAAATSQTAAPAGPVPGIYTVPGLKAAQVRTKEADYWGKSFMGLIGKLHEQGRENDVNYLMSMQAQAAAAGAAGRERGAQKLPEATRLWAQTEKETTERNITALNQQLKDFRKQKASISGMVARQRELSEAQRAGLPPPPEADADIQTRLKAEQDRIDALKDFLGAGAKGPVPRKVTVNAAPLMGGPLAPASAVPANPYR